MYRHAASTRFDLLKTKRDRLLGWRGAERQFGAWWAEWNAHHSKWGCASVAALSALEARCGVRLPEDYRRFVTEIANGGLGPGCGMFSVEKAFDDAPEWTGDVSAPFLYGDDDARRVLDKRAGDDRFHSLKLPDQQELPNGCLLLAHTGCGCFDILVITGEQRDRVWGMDTRRLCPLSEGGKPVSFLDWYESWLDGWLKSAAS
jgi:hypothetical protein